MYIQFKINLKNRFLSLVTSLTNRFYCYRKLQPENAFQVLSAALTWQVGVSITGLQHVVVLVALLHVVRGVVVGHLGEYPLNHSEIVHDTGVAALNTENSSIFRSRSSLGASVVICWCIADSRRRTIISGWKEGRGVGITSYLPRPGLLGGSIQGYSQKILEWLLKLHQVHFAGSVTTEE